MKKTLAYVSHLVMMLIRLSEMARKLEKTDKKTRLYGCEENEILTLTGHVNQVYL